jgi:anthranilate phosphoribosyltransferase
VLASLRVKGVVSDELAAFASVMRENAEVLDHGHENVVDTCGTGGGTPSFNISTASAVVAAAAGVRIAKHGNRAVTSSCGSADVLEALGVKVTAPMSDLVDTLHRHGIVFLFAPSHHPAMKHVGKARRELGFRTVFNQLGPLANPAQSKRQLIGVYDPALMPAMGEALCRLETERAILAHGHDGLDEISPVAPTDIVRVWDGKVFNETWRPQDFGIDPIDAKDILPGEDLASNAALFREAITDVDSPRCHAIIPSAACAIWISGVADTAIGAAERAREVVSSGMAAAKLKEMAS